MGLELKNVDDYQEESETRAENVEIQVEYYNRGRGWCWSGESLGLLVKATLKLSPEWVPGVAYHRVGEREFL